jgi:glycerol-3-phosphate acyltransferase PlsX
VSAGNTGALMATGRYVLKTVNGIDRPAIISALPSIDGHTHVLDLGANIDCTSEHLFQFAVMGSMLAHAIDNIDSPRVGLLNIGEEEMKGNDTIKIAAQLLAESNLNYIGFVEGDGIYKGGVDVVVCDGFVGNVALKTSEGVAKMISHYMKEEFTRNFITKIIGMITRPVLKSFRKKIDPRRYNGASLVGLRGIVIKSHGGADVIAFENAIDIAVMEIDKDVPAMISSQIDALMTERKS